MTAPKKTKDHPIVREIVSDFLTKTAGSGRLHDQAKAVMPGGDTRTTTFFQPHPLYLDYGQGARLYDVDGNEYIDFVNNYTSLIHGHGHGPSMEATQAQAAKGFPLGGPGPEAILLAEHLKNRVPALEAVRFCNSGTEATMFAVRAARAFTGRDKIIKIDGGYHGSHDLVEVNLKPDLSAPDPNGPGLPKQHIDPGVPQSVLADALIAPFNDLAAMEKLFGLHKDIAAVLIEPMLGAGGGIEAEPGYLKDLSELARRNGALFIADEIQTLRMAYPGLADEHGVQPDLVTLGKLIGGGFPIGAFGGRAEVMDVFNPGRSNAVAHGGTFNGHNGAMAAGLAALKDFDQAALNRLNDLSDKLRAKLDQVIQASGLTMNLGGCRSIVTINWSSQAPLNAAQAYSTRLAAGPLPGLVHLEMLNQGINIAARGFFCLSTPMSEADLDQAAQAFGRTLERIKPAAVELVPEVVG